MTLLRRWETGLLYPETLFLSVIIDWNLGSISCFSQHSKSADVS